MPSFLDYLLAPWKVFQLLFPPAPPQAAAPIPVGISGAVANGANATANAAQSGVKVIGTGLCYMKDVGGQILHVCNVAGYEMPSFVFWASLLIFGIFAFSSFMLLKQCANLSRALNRLAGQIKKVQPTENGMLSSQGLATIRNHMQKERLASHPWREFEDTLLVTSSGEEVYTTQSVDHVFSRTSLIDDNVSIAFFNAVPGILTGVGLLMTFVAILDGLSHVSVSANMDVQGIAGLINGLSGKFVSSIVAVTCAVSFVFVERIAYSGPQLAHRKLVQILGSRFKRRTAEHLLFSLQQQLAAQMGLGDGGKSHNHLRARGGQG